MNEHRVNCNTYEDQQPLKAYGKQGLDVVLPGAAKMCIRDRVQTAQSAVVFLRDTAHGKHIRCV